MIKPVKSRLHNLKRLCLTIHFRYIWLFLFDEPSDNIVFVHLPKQGWNENNVHINFIILKDYQLVWGGGGGGGGAA